MRRPKIKLDNLVVFMAVADRHGIDGAAVELGLSPSGVRKHLVFLESTFGIRFFEKRQGRLFLSEDGALFYNDAAKAVEQAILAEEQVYARQAIREHHLVVGHSTNLPPKLISVIIQLQFDNDPVVLIEHRTGLTSTVIRDVLDRTLHAGFGILPIRSSELLVRTVYEEPLVACLPTGHRLAMKPVVSPQDFDGEPMIAVSREPWPERHQEIEDHCAGFGVVLRVVADAYSSPEALAYVEQRRGFCLLPASAVAGRQGIVMKPLSTHVLMRRSGVFIREDNPFPLVHKLVDTALAKANELRVKHGLVSIGLPVVMKEEVRKVKRIS